MKIGIMGGTFNPIHNGHLILSEYIREEANLDKIIFIPAGRPPHKKNPEVLNSNTRKEMLDLAIESNSYFEVSTLEIDKDDISYTIDTVNELKKIYPKDEIYLIIGGDSLLELEKWKDFKRLISITNFIVVDRHGSSSEEVIKKIKELNRTYNGNITRFHSPIIEISSTDIRKRIKKGLSIKYLVPEGVEEHIISKELYK